MITPLLSFIWSSFCCSFVMRGWRWRGVNGEWSLKSSCQLWNVTCSKMLTKSGSNYVTMQCERGESIDLRTKFGVCNMCLKNVKEYIEPLEA